MKNEYGVRPDAFHKAMSRAAAAEARVKELEAKIARAIVSQDPWIELEKK